MYEEAVIKEGYCEPEEIRRRTPQEGHENMGLTVRGAER